MNISFALALLICILSFLVWVGSLIVIIVVKKNDSAPPEIIRLRKRVMGLNIALVCAMVYRFFSISLLYRGRISFLYFRIAGLPMIVLAVLCIIDSVKLLNARSQAQQQFGRQDYQQQNYIPQQQTQSAQQQQSAKCPHCGAEIEAGSYFCGHCGKKF